MPGATLPGNHTATFGKTIARVERIERNTVPLRVQPPAEMIFSYPGALIANTESPPWYVPRSGQLDSVRVSLTSAASANHTIAVRVNGVEAQQFTVTTGLKTVTTSAAISIALGDYVTVKTITVADSNLSVGIRLR